MNEPPLARQRTASSPASSTPDPSVRDPSAPASHAPDPGPAAAPRRRRGPRAYAGIAVKGFAMGASDIIPGVSGGTMALILGVYQELIAALGAFSERATFRALVERRPARLLERIHAGFLLALGVGIGAAVLTLSGVLLFLLETQRAAVYALFFGLIAASAWVVGGRVARWGAGSVASLLLGGVVAFGVTGLTPTATADTPLVFFGVGMIALCALVLPGISGAFIVLLLGKYDQLLGALRTFDLSVIVPFGLGGAVGLLGFARVLKLLLTHRPNVTLALLTGFLIGSLRKVWPWQEALAGGAELTVNVAPPGTMALLGAAALAVGGAALVLFLERLGAD